MRPPAFVFCYKLNTVLLFFSVALLFLPVMGNFITHDVLFFSLPAVEIVFVLRPLVEVHLFFRCCFGCGFNSCGFHSC